MDLYEKQDSDDEEWNDYGDKDYDYFDQDETLTVRRSCLAFLFSFFSPINYKHTVKNLYTPTKRRPG